MSKWVNMLGVVGVVVIVVVCVIGSIVVSISVIV